MQSHNPNQKKMKVKLERKITGLALAVGSLKLSMVTAQPEESEFVLVNSLTQAWESENGAGNGKLHRRLSPIVFFYLSPLSNQKKKRENCLI